MGDTSTALLTPRCQPNSCAKTAHPRGIWAKFRKTSIRTATCALFCSCPPTAASKLDKAMASGADAVIIDLEDSIAPERKDLARAAALDFLKRAAAAAQRPRLLVRINGLETGHDGCRPRCNRRGQAGRRRVSRRLKAATSVVHLDAKLTAREAIAGVPEGQIKVLAQAVESAAGTVCRRHIPRRKHAADRIDMGSGGPFGRDWARTTNRDAQGELTEPYRLARSVCLYAAAAAKAVGDRDRLRRFPQFGRIAPRHRSRAPRWFHRASGHPPGPGAGDQRGVHADRGRDREGQGAWLPHSPRSRVPARSASMARCTTGRISRAHKHCWRSTSRVAVLESRARGLACKPNPDRNVLSASRNSSVTAPVLPSGTAR